MCIVVSLWVNVPVGPPSGFSLRTAQGAQPLHMKYDPSAVSLHLCWPRKAGQLLSVVPEAAFKLPTSEIRRSSGQAITDLKASHFADGNRTI
uniref:Uncharacterized protein n=1 Tax=Ascaris lumbricoides TaxID=6252 RepID=A0A9J2Q982_ASCLU